MSIKKIFLELSIEEQFLLTMDGGTTLLARKEGDLSIVLFEFAELYIEVKFDIKHSKIISVDVVELKDVEDDYLDDIQIENLS
ncbi:MAG TPA: hypothetical protein DCG69_07800 [Bacteroidales bacterium]|nr:hypothetical protein [Bacteroidales bacterium]